jgi:uncharacterized protein (TIGR02145 family)
VGIKISILQGSANGAAVYAETHSPLTNSNGLATLEIGGGTLLSGNFANINWASGPNFVKTETDLNGGSNYTITNTQQLLSVPYALFSSSANTANTAIIATTAGNGVPAGGSSGQVLTNCNGLATWTTAGQCPGTITNLNCSGASTSGTLTAYQLATEVSISIPYTSGGGGTHDGQIVASSGVSGLTATLEPGIFASGPGALTYTITGTPVSTGTASFALNIGGQNCLLTCNVIPPVGSITSLNCTSATLSGTLIEGVTSSSVSINVPYTGGNGGTYIGQFVNSTGVLGLTAMLSLPGTFAIGESSVNYIITGTPVTSGTASFAISIGGQTCSLNFTVDSGGQSGIAAHSCGATNVHNPAKTYGIMTDQEGNVYKTILIGTQEWMAENLKTSKYRNGEAISNVTSNQWSFLTIGAWCYYNNDSQYECPYGKLYNWYAVADGRNLCPAGWHIPSYTEWDTLITYLGGQSVSGGKMKSAGTQYWVSPNSAADNGSGFSGLPCGYRRPDGSFYDIGNVSILWSSTENSTIGLAWGSYLDYIYGGADGNNYDTDNGFPVRCLRD